MTDEALERAYTHGDHRAVRALARRILESSTDAELLARARQLLAYTEPDRFLAWVALLGLGLVGWLVYNYVP